MWKSGGSSHAIHKGLSWQWDHVLSIPLHVFPPLNRVASFQGCTLQCCRRRHLRNITNQNVKFVCNTFLGLFCGIFWIFTTLKGRYSWSSTSILSASMNFCQPQIKSIFKKKKLCLRPWGDGWVVRSAGCSCREPDFDSQDLHGTSASYKSSSRGSEAFLWPLWVLYAHGTLTFLNTHEHTHR